MQVRFGTSHGIELAHVVHWTYEETPEEPPVQREPPLDDEVYHTPLPVLPEEPPPTEGVFLDPNVPPPSSAAPAPLGAPPEPEVATTAMIKTLTLYMTGTTEPLVFTDDEAAALLGVLVSQSGSLT